MSEPFQPPPEELPPLASLVTIADVTGEDIRDAEDNWEENPPDKNFKLVLRAEDAQE